MNKIKVLYPVLFIFLFCFSAQAQKNESIDEQSRKLASVQNSIKQKQIEKDRLVQDEKAFKREVASLDKMIGEAENKLKIIAQDIKNAEKKLDDASQKYDSAQKQKEILNKDISQELSLFNKLILTESYQRNPVEYKVRRKGIEHKQQKFDNQEQTASISSQEMTKWERARRDLLSLRKRENDMTEDRKRLINQKNKLLQNTSTRRKQTEGEIKKLNESAKDLQTVIDRLIIESRKRKEAEEAAIKKKAAEEAARKAAAEKKAAAIKAAPQIVTITQAPPVTISPQAPEKTQQRSPRKILPWPVSGTVISNFGRNKHPELDTYIVNNGIKIKAANGSSVKSVDNGSVVFRGAISSYGKVIIIEHNTFFSVYGQLNDMSVSIGEIVKKGSIIGKLGVGDNSILYFEIRRDDVPDNPMFWLQ